MKQPETDHHIFMQPQTSVTEFDQSCRICMEESQVCECDHSQTNYTGSVKEVQNGDIHKANSSFFQAAINMTRMLIGLGQLRMRWKVVAGPPLSSLLPLEPYLPTLPIS
ncbi:unnamed protein product [Rhodiola kirilowii]